MWPKETGKIEEGEEGMKEHVPERSNMSMQNKDTPVLFDELDIDIDLARELPGLRAEGETLCRRKKKQGMGLFSMNLNRSVWR